MTRSAGAYPSTSAPVSTASPAHSRPTVAPTSRCGGRGEGRARRRGRTVDAAARPHQHFVGLRLGLRNVAATPVPAPSQRRLSCALRRSFRSGHLYPLHSRTSCCLIALIANTSHWEAPLQEQLGDPQGEMLVRAQIQDEEVKERTSTSDARWRQPQRPTCSPAVRWAVSGAGSTWASTRKTSSGTRRPTWKRSPIRT